MSNGVLQERPDDAPDTTDAPSLAFATTAAPEQAPSLQLLLESLADHAPGDGLPEVYVYVTDEQALRPSLEWVTVVEGDYPVPGYPVSAKLGAFEAAADRTSADAVCLLDADTVLLDDFDVHTHLAAADAPVAAKPVDVAHGPPDDEWRALYEYFDCAWPPAQIASTVDRLPVYPHYNAGVVVTTNLGFPADWRTTVEAAREAVLPDEPHAAQLVLGMLGQEAGIRHLTERYNYPVPHRTRIPDDTVVAHHHGEFIGGGHGRSSDDDGGRGGPPGGGGDGDGGGVVGEAELEDRLKDLGYLQ